MERSTGEEADRALDDLDLDQLDIVLLENVGNLVCPTHWTLGEQIKLCLVGAAEGHDKAVKYPEMFAASDVIVLNNIDLAELVDFDFQFFRDSGRAESRRTHLTSSLAGTAKVWQRGRTGYSNSERRSSNSPNEPEEVAPCAFRL